MGLRKDLVLELPQKEFILEKVFGKIAAKGKVRDGDRAESFLRRAGWIQGWTKRTTSNV